MTRALPLLAAAVLAGCAGLKPGLTKEGVALEVSAPDADSARKTAAASSLDLFLAPDSDSAPRALEALKAAAPSLAGRTRFKKGKGVVEIRLAKAAAALEKEGLLRPAGYAAAEPRVMLLVAEPQGILDLGVGPGADALRRSLSAYGMQPTDGRDSLNGLNWKNGTAPELVERARRMGSDWLLVAAAGVSAEPERASGMWTGKATFVADAYDVTSSTPVEQVRADASVLDVSSSAARGKALEEAGESAASKAAGIIVKAGGGRSQAAVFASGGVELPRLRGLLAAIRRVDGVAGAYLVGWDEEEGSAILRAYLRGIKADGLAARLLRADSSMTLISVEPDAGRLQLELPGGKE